MKKHRNIVLVGMMGSGKSAVGLALARELAWLYHDLDDRILADYRAVANEKATIPMIFDQEGEEGFRDRETAALLAVTACTHTVLSTGGGAVLSSENCALMRRWGLVVLLEADTECLARRLREEVAARPLIAHENDLRGKLTELREIRATSYSAAAHHTIDTAALSIGKVVNRILALATLDREEDAL